MSERTNTARWVENRKHWRIDVQRDGIRKPFYSSTPGRKGQRECNAKADKWLEGNISDQNIRVEKAFELFIQNLQDNKNISSGHWKKYQSKGEYHILPIIGKKKVINLTDDDLQQIIDKAYNHKDKDKPLSKKTYAGIRECVNSFIKFCRRKNFTKLHPEIELPKNAKKGQRTILQPNDAQTLFYTDYTIYRGKEYPEIYINAYRFEMVNGLRPGEVKGLKWSDIINGKVYIKRSINVDGDITEGKNENAVRSFALNDYSKMILGFQKNLLKTFGIESGYVFPNKYGEPADQSTYYKHWIKYRDYHGLSKCSPYELRHTFVSMMKGLPEGLLKTLVGHSKDMDTFGVYGHEVEGEAEIIASKVQTVLKDIIK